MQRALMLLSIMLISATVQAGDKLKPFILAEQSSLPMAELLHQTETKLSNSGFEITGSYQPYAGVHILVITNDKIKQAAASSKHGGYAAGLRVALVVREGSLQLSYTNPVYLAHAYRLKEDMKDVLTQLKLILGFQQDFGAKKGLSADQLHDYHYTFGMEYFDEPSKLGEFDTHQLTLDAVEEGLAAGRGGAHKVYRIDIPGKQETVFGVALSKSCSSDEFIMGHIDFQPLSSAAHLPYEILVSGNQVLALYARFRIAINFPDLKMMGANSFMKIMCAPGEIEAALKEVVHP